MKRDPGTEAETNWPRSSTLKNVSVLKPLPKCVGEATLESKGVGALESNGDGAQEPGWEPGADMIKCASRAPETFIGDGTRDTFEDGATEGARDMRRDPGADAARKRLRSCGM